MIELKDVSFTYESGETENNLSHINLAIQDGETILLCGESGCGKTTLTRLINGLIPHYYGGKLTGQVLLDGKELKDYPLYQIGQRVGSVFQNPRTQFYNVDTTSEIVFGCENVGMTKKQISKMLVAEGFLYLGGAFMIAVLLVVVGAKQILINTLGTAFFFRLHLTIVPCVLMIPILVGIAYVIPKYQFEKMSRESIVERIRKE